MARGDSPAPAIEVACAGHSDVYQASLDLELALAAPATELTSWLLCVAQALHRLGSVVSGQPAAVEGPDGLYAEVMAQAPRVSHRIDRLRAQHADLAVLVSEALQSVGRAGAGDRRCVDDVRDECLQLFVKASRYRHDTTDLIHEAFDVELGGGD